MAAGMVDESLISAPEAAQILGVSMNNLRQMQHRKRLCWVSKVGRKVYYRRDEVEALAQKRQGSNG